MQKPDVYYNKGIGICLSHPFLIFYLNFITVKIVAYKKFLIKNEKRYIFATAKNACSAAATVCSKSALVCA